MKKIVFFIESLDGGGAERALTLMVENLDKQKYEITVVSETDGEEFTERILKACRHRCFAKKAKRSRNIFKKIWNRIVFKFSCAAPLSTVHRVFIGEKYDIEIAFCEGYATRLIAASPNKNSIKIAWIHTDVINNPWSEKMYDSAASEKACYRKFNRICCVSEQVMLAAAEKFGIGNKAAVVHNPVSEAEITVKSKQAPGIKPFNGIRMIAAGRLTYQKAFDRLIRIAGSLKKEGYRFELLILGKGEEQNSLEGLIRQCDVSDCVRLTGYIENPYNYIAASDFYVCSSIAEGFSTVATEAILLGKPVITTKCAGMTELFGSADCGLICDNEESALYEAVRFVLDDPSRLAAYSKNCVERAKSFSLETNLKNIERVFDAKR